MQSFSGRLDDQQIVAERRPFYEAPEFVERVTVFEEVCEGDSVTFQCVVRACPSPVVDWFKDDVQVSTLSHDGRLTAEHTNVATSSLLLRLVIRDARKDDEGAYRCKAENEEGVAATTGYLSVTGSSLSARVNCSNPEQSSTVELHSITCEQLDYDSLTVDNARSQLDSSINAAQPPRNSESGSDMALQTDVKSSTEPWSHSSTEPWTDSLLDQCGAADDVDVNVFVVETNVTTIDDMKPLLMEQPHDDSIQHDISAPATFHAVQTGSADVFRPAALDMSDVLVGMTEVGGTAVPVGRRVVELNCCTVFEFYTSWFDAPWLVYVLVVMSATLMASATDADAATLIIIMIIVSAFCFLLFPPPDKLLTARA